jgi:hypothetical protein
VLTSRAGSAHESGSRIITETTKTQAIDQEVLVKQYAVASGMLTQSNTRRTATARFYISLVAGLVGLLAIVHRPGLDSEIQLWVTNLVCLLAILLNCIWYMTIRAMRHLCRVQRSLLSEMEESLPFAFITRQKSLIEKSSRLVNAGAIEQYVPIAMMIPVIIVMLMTNLG